MYFKDAATGKFEIVDQVGGMLAYVFKLLVEISPSC